MDNSQRNINKLIWFSSGIMTNIFYIIIVLALLFQSNFEAQPSDVLPIFLPCVGSTLILSSLVIYKGLKDNKSLNWGIIWLAVFHLPSLIGLILAFIQFGR